MSGEDLTSSIFDRTAPYLGLDAFGLHEHADRADDGIAARHDAVGGERGDMGPPTPPCPQPRRPSASGGELAHRRRGLRCLSSPGLSIETMAAPAEEAATSRTSFSRSRSSPITPLIVTRAICAPMCERSPAKPPAGNGYRHDNQRAKRGDAPERELARQQAAFDEIIWRRRIHVRFSRSAS
ncbi:MAG: hypothetical protein U1E30_03235 [Rhodoblastus sp.]